MTAKPYNSVFGFPLENFIHTDCPHYWKYGKKNESELDFTRRVANNLEKKGIECKVVIDTSIYSGFPSRNISNWFETKNSNECPMRCKKGF